MSDTTRLRAGVVGLGWAGQQHMAGYAALDNVDLVALAGMEAEPLAKLGDQYGADGRYADWQTMISEANLDVVSICTPTALHGPIAVAALEAGIHVLSEKPMAQDATTAAEMVAAAQANDRVLDISFNHRLHGEVQAMKKVIDDGLLGDIYYAKAGWLRCSGIPGLGSWFTKAALAGGGAMMDIGVHMLDMSLFLLGEPEVASVSAAKYAEFGPKGRGGSASYRGPATLSDPVDFEVEDLATAFVRLSSGGTLLLESSWAQWIPEDQIYVTIYGSEGGASLDWKGNLTVWTEIKGTPAVLHPTVGRNGGHAKCVADFIDTVIGGDFEGHRGETALTRAKVLDAAYASAAKGAEVTLG